MKLRSSSTQPRAGAVPTVSQEESTSHWREELVTAILRIGSAVGALALIFGIANFIEVGRWDIVAIYIVVYLFFLGIAVLRSLPYWLRAGAIMGVVFALALTTLTFNGLSSAGRLYLFVFAVLGFLLFGPRMGLVSLAVSVLTLAGVGWMVLSGRLDMPPDVQVTSNDPVTWTVAVVVFLLLALCVNVSIFLLQRNFLTTLKREREARAELQREREFLEQRVVERTRTIERRTAQVVTGADIARAAGTELDPGKLLQQVVDLIRERFDLYYVGAFLVDEKNQFATLQAGTGQAGQVMLANNHRLEVGGQSMIGRAISERAARIALDVGQEAVRFNNPILPLTRSEMALPLAARDHVIGALTVQSDQPSAFSPEDILSLQGMADLIAIALDNARLFQEARRALEEVTTVHKSYITQAWSRFAQAHSEKGAGPASYTYADNMLSRGDTPALPDLKRALIENKPVVRHDASASLVTVPIKLRDQVIGAIAIEADSPDRTWKPEELALIEAIIEQTALSLENARLIEEAETALSETRRFATREQAVNLISNKLRRLPTVESVLTTALLELSQVLGASKGLVRLGTSAKRIAEVEADRE